MPQGDRDEIRGLEIPETEWQRAVVRIDRRKWRGWVLLAQPEFLETTIEGANRQTERLGRLPLVLPVATEGGPDQVSLRLVEGGQALVRRGRGSALARLRADR